MRVTGGLYGGRILEAPKDNNIRPTSDKVRLAIFNMLESRGLVRDAVVLDAFCGTGALGIEAISRGSLCCTFIDKNRSSLELCRKNYAALKIDAKSNFVVKDSTKAGEKPADFAAANLVFLDPPYNKGLVALTLEALYAGGWIADGAAIVIETERGFDPAGVMGHEVLMSRDYGDTRVSLITKAE